MVEVEMRPPEVFVRELAPEEGGPWQGCIRCALKKPADRALIIREHGR